MRHGVVEAVHSYGAMAAVRLRQFGLFSPFWVEEVRVDALANSVVPPEGSSWLRDADACQCAPAIRDLAADTARAADQARLSLRMLHSVAVTQVQDTGLSREEYGRAIGLLVRYDADPTQAVVEIMSGLHAPVRSAEEFATFVAMLDLWHRMFRVACDRIGVETSVAIASYASEFTRHG